MSIGFSIKSLILSIVDLVLYSNFWIAAGAFCMCLQTQFLFLGDLRPHPVWGFIFTGTLFLYGMHRLIGLPRAAAFTSDGRFKVISNFRYHIWTYTVFGGFAALGFFIALRPITQVSLVLPSLLALAYVSPILGNKKRLRDLAFIKIFLIATIWPFITVCLPALEFGIPFTWEFIVYYLEKALFLFAITLPFDIRDYHFDKAAGLKTLPIFWGPKTSIFISLGALIIAFVMAAWISNYGIYQPSQLTGLFLLFIYTGLLVFFSGKVQQDYYFTGLLDGTLILQFFSTYI